MSSYGSLEIMAKVPQVSAQSTLKKMFYTMIYYQSILNIDGRFEVCGLPQQSIFNTY